MVTLTAIKPLSGSYGLVHEGGTFQTDEETAEALEARGWAQRYRLPKFPAHDPSSFKMAMPPQNKMLPLQSNKAKRA